MLTDIHWVYVSKIIFMTQICFKAKARTSTCMSGWLDFGTGWKLINIILSSPVLRF
jgi:hypothetical protein